MKREPAHTLDNDNEFVTALADGAMVSLREMEKYVSFCSLFEIYNVNNNLTVTALYLYPRQ